LQVYRANAVRNFTEGPFLFRLFRATPGRGRIDHCLAARKSGLPLTAWQHKSNTSRYEQTLAQDMIAVFLGPRERYVLVAAPRFLEGASESSLRTSFWVSPAS
jgi:hypothetical protein